MKGQISLQYFSGQTPFPRQNFSFQAFKKLIFLNKTWQWLSKRFFVYIASFASLMYGSKGYWLKIASTEMSKMNILNNEKKNHHISFYPNTILYIFWSIVITLSIS